MSASIFNPHIVIHLYRLDCVSGDFAAFGRVIGARYPFYDQDLDWIRAVVYRGFYRVEFELSFQLQTVSTKRKLH